LLGVQPTVVFLGSHEPLSQVLEQDRIPYHSLGWQRGSRVLVHPRRFAAVVGSYGADGALLDSTGYVALALRAGGYRKRVVSVEHGALIQGGLSPRQMLVRSLGRTAGVQAIDIEVAVSDFLLQELLRHAHAREVVRIHNGVDLDVFSPGSAPADDVLSIGWAGRMVPGKGVPELLQAIALLGQDVPVELHLAGDGPDREAIEQLVDELELVGKVVFSGPVLDLGSFWAGRDVGVFPTNGFVETFGLAAVEAMACGRPVIASRSGGLEEIVEDGRTGLLVERGDIEGIAEALRRYALDESLRARHGREARKACEERFDIRHSARSYLALFEP
jgi:glycosyltransferase involved in cell wall biosynthesis